MGEKKDKEGSALDRTVVTSINKIAGRKPKRGYFFFLAGPLLGKLFPLSEGRVVIGRNPTVDIPINDTRVSREHIEVSVEGEVVRIKDMGSTNGTFVNGERITEHVLHDDDKIQVSPATIFKFALADEDEKIAFDELYELGVIDPLTNVYNKRYFIERLKEEMSHSKRLKASLTLVMLDIDFFKKVNDTHGHLAGDAVLVKMAKVLQSMTRQEDIVARYGGEEFVMILRNTPEDGAHLLAERIRTTVAGTPVAFENKTINFTISMGIATLNEKNDFSTLDDFIAAADKCLYHSKENGRNQTTRLSQIS